MEMQRLMAVFNPKTGASPFPTTIPVALPPNSASNANDNDYKVLEMSKPLGAWWTATAEHIFMRRKVVGKSKVMSPTRVADGSQTQVGAWNYYVLFQLNAP